MESDKLYNMRKDENFIMSFNSFKAIIEELRYFDLEFKEALVLLFMRIVLRKELVVRQRRIDDAQYLSIEWRYSNIPAEAR